MTWNAGDEHDCYECGKELGRNRVAEKLLPAPLTSGQQEMLVGAKNKILWWWGLLLL